MRPIHGMQNRPGISSNPRRLRENGHRWPQGHFHTCSRMVGFPISLHLDQDWLPAAVIGQPHDLHQHRPAPNILMLDRRCLIKTLEPSPILLDEGLTDENTPRQGFVLEVAFPVGNESSQCNIG